MPRSGSGPPRASELARTLAAEGVTHLVGLPDSTSAALLELAGDPPAPALVPVTREGEAFAIASGLWLGGKAAVVVIQSTGLLESGDALRGTAARMGVPLVAFVTYRGFRTLGGRRSGDPPDRDDLVRADVDSAARLLEPTLRAWGVPYDVVETAADLARVGAAFAKAREEERPVAVLLARPLC